MLDALERASVADDTLVIFTSDNGPEHIDGHAAAAYERAKEYGHYSMDGLRGIKYGSWEGGHRVPFVARWPDAIPAGTATDETICLTDLMRTLASILGDSLPQDAGEDSYDVSAALRGTVTDGPIREATVHHAADGHLAIRKGDWVLIENPTGDVTDDEPDWFREERGYEDHDQPGELYDLSSDRIQRTNRYADRPEKVEELQSLLDQYRDSGRSAPA